MKTNELIDLALDWAVAKCEGYAGVALQERTGTDWYSPSTDWAQGGPIIEREGISLECHGEEWLAFKLGVDYYAEGTPDEFPCGPTPLIAAMRCYVASRLGDTIDIPEELQ